MATVALFLSALGVRPGTHQAAELLRSHGHDPGRGHLFADPSKTDEYQPADAELMWSRVLDFLERTNG